MAQKTPAKKPAAKPATKPAQATAKKPAAKPAAQQTKPATKPAAAPAKKPAAPAPQAEKRVYKTKRKVAGGDRNYRSWNQWEPGDELVGEYVGTHEDNYGKNSRTLKVIECSWDQELEGKDLTLNANGVVEKAFGDEEQPIEIGEVVRLTYHGVEKLTKGPYKGKEFHKIEIEVVVEEGSEQDTGGVEDDSLGEGEEDFNGGEDFSGGDDLGDDDSFAGEDDSFVDDSEDGFVEEDNADDSNDEDEGFL